MSGFTGRSNTSPYSVLRLVPLRDRSPLREPREQDKDRDKERDREMEMDREKKDNHNVVDKPIEYIDQTAQKCAMCSRYLFDNNVSPYKNPKSPYNNWLCHNDCLGIDV